MSKFIIFDDAIINKNAIIGARKRIEYKNNENGLIEKSLFLIQLTLINPIIAQGSKSNGDEFKFKINPLEEIFYLGEEEQLETRWNELQDELNNE